MHDPKFEKEVQQKMEELVFTPSASVWTKVEQAVNERERRRTSLLWWFLLPGIGLTGALLLYFSSVRGPYLQKKVTPAATYSTATADPGVGAHPAVANPTREGSDQGAPGVPPFVPGTNNTTTTTTVPGASLPAGAGRNGVAGVRLYSNAGGAQARRSHLMHPDPMVAGTGSKSGSSDGGEKFNSADIIPAGAGTEGSVRSPGHPVSPIGLPSRSIILPGLAAIDGKAFSVKAPPPASRLSKKDPIKLKPKNKWEAGFIGGAGVSSVNEGLLRGTTTVPSDVRANAAPITGSPHTSLSSARPYLSYWAGIYLKRSLQQRFSVSLGLDLHYYSSQVQVGEKVSYNNIALATSSSLFIGSITSAAAQPTAPYYVAGTDYTYTNHYYFLELPASLQWHFNRSTRLPLYWEGGVSLAYLVSSNALYYNMKSGVYLKDGTVSNKTQLNLSTALLVGLPVRGFRLAIGPQVQYGLTNLLNTQSTGGEHLFYGGIKIVLSR